MFRPIALTVMAMTLPGAAPASGGAGQVATLDPVTVADGEPAGLTLRISYPPTGRRLPVVILSHGFHLSRSNYQPLVRSLVEAGFVVIQPDHPDASVDGFAPLGPEDRDSWRKRVVQVRWIAGHIAAATRQVPGLSARIDAGRVAVVGHSFGGHTAELTMGATVIDPATDKPLHFGTPAIAAAVLLSPPGAEDGLTEQWKRLSPYLKVDWTTMRGPVLIIVGGNDNVWGLPQGPLWLTDGFRRSATGHGICLMTSEGAGHYLGGIDGPLHLPAGDATPERLARVRTATIAFLRASLYPADARRRAQWVTVKRDIACK